MKVLLTRQEDDARKSAAALRKAGHDPVIVPLFELEAVEAELEATGFDGIILTSGKAAAILAELPVSKGFSGFSGPVFCVGTATAHAATKAGLGDVRCGPGDAAGLAAWIADSITAGAKLLYPCAAHRAFDMVAALPRHEVHETVVYRSVAIDPGQCALAAALQECSGGAAFLYSARGAMQLARLAEKHELEKPLAELVLVAISPRSVSGKAFAGSRILIAETANEASMLAKLEEILPH